MPAKLVQRRRGTTANHSVFAGAEGEITQDTTKNTLVSHDGNTQGGHPLAKEDMSNVVGTAAGGGVGIVQLNLSDGGNGQVLTTDGSGNMSFQSIDVNNDMQLGGDLSGSISNAQIITNAVGLTELNVTAPTTGGQLLSADGSGNLQFITPASNMTLSGDVSGNLSNTQIVAQAVGTPELATNAVTTVKISDLNVTSDKIADGSITTNKIAGLSVTTDKITDGNITLAKMADNSVRTGNIIDANVTTAKLAPLSVDGTKIAAGAVDSTKIAAGAVTSTKIANNAVGVTQLSVQSDGNAGEFLQTNGAGVLSFATAASTLTGGSGGLQSIQSFTTNAGEAGGNNTEQTWTKPAGINRILYYVIGAGGTGFNAGGNSSGTGGSSGSMAVGVLDVSGITSLQLRIGNGGGGSGTNNPQPQGWNTYLGTRTFGTIDSKDAEGSIATGVSPQGTQVATALGGDLNIKSNHGFNYGGSHPSVIGGRGGFTHWSPFGDGGSGGGTSGDAGNDQGAPTTFGSAGNAGIVIIFEYA
jgi:hypothetical protein